MPPPYLKNMNPDLFEQMSDGSWAISRKGSELILEYYYGPTQYLLMYPFLLFSKTRGDVEIGLAIFYYSIIILSSILLYIFLFKKFNKFYFLIFYIILFNWSSMYDCLYQKNIEIFEAFLIILSLYTIKTKWAKLKTIGTPLTLILAALCKIKTIIFLPYYLIKNNYKLSFYFIIILIMAILLTHFTININKITIFNSYKTYSDSNGFLTSPTESTLKAGIVRLFAADIDLFKKTSPGNTPEVKLNKNKTKIALKTYNIIFLLFISLYFILFLINRQNWDYIDIEYALIIIAMVVFSPHSMNYYYFLLIIPNLIALKLLITKQFSCFYKIKRWILVMIYLVSTLLLTYGGVPPSLWKKVLPINYSIQEFYILANLDIYGGLLLFIVLLTYYIHLSSLKSNIFYKKILQYKNKLTDFLAGA